MSLMKFSKRHLSLIAAVVVSSLLCLLLLAIRVFFTRQLTYSFLVWNLFLAGLPVVSALIADQFHQHSLRMSWAWVGGCAMLWLLFLPNAPYLITDLMHLKPRDNFFFWFDLVMFFAFAWTGLFWGLVSLFLMQGLVRKMAGSVTSWVFVVVVTGLSSFGIYLGRFPRWNSWDVASQPTILVADIWERVSHPFAHLQTYAFSALFTFFLMAAYLMLVAVTNLRHESE